jgi:Putative beta-barrel porin-2, OmpL-like. bbp2
MKCNKWTMALAAAGVVSLGSVVQAEEAQHQVLTALSSTTLSGYIDTSATWKLGTDQGGGRLPGHVFDGADKMDGFNLDAIKLTLAKPLDEGQWAAGYNVDLIFGSNANFYQAVPNGGFGGIPTANTSDFAIKNAYVELRAPVGNGIDIKVGVFDTIIGYEVFDAVGNPNYSRSYGFALEPTQHTGILLSYKFTDWLSAAAGVANTAFGPINDRGVQGIGNTPIESSKAYMGSVTVTLPDAAGSFAGSTFYVGVVNGFDGNSVFGAPNGETERTSSYYAGATVKTPLDGLAVGAAFDYRTDFGSTMQPGLSLPENKAYAVAGYLSYSPKDSKFKINDRVDYTNADPGTWYPAGEPGVSAMDPNREHLLSNTLTVDYSLWDNVITRGEFRWDHSLTGDRPFGGTDNPMKNAFILAANIIYKF